MADENESTKTYILAADGLRLDGRRYRRGDKVELPAERGDGLVESGSLVENEDDLQPRDTSGAATAGLADVASESSTLYASQSLDDDGEIKKSSFGHPDRVAEAEEAAKEQEERADATKPAARRRSSTTTTATSTTSGGEQSKPARTSER